MMSDQPYENAPAADFVRTHEPAYTLVGIPESREGKEENAPVRLRLSRGEVREYDEPFRHVFDFFLTPRTASQAREWLVWAGAPVELLEVLVNQKVLIAAGGDDPFEAAQTFAGVHVVPFSIPNTTESVQDGLIEVKADEQAPGDFDVPVQLGHILWSTSDDTDIPGAIEAIVEFSGADRRTTARLALADLPMLLRAGFARLEWLRV